MVTGRPINSVVRRIKVGALFHDRIVLQGGEWEAHGGPNGGMKLYKPAPNLAAKWQCPRERGTALTQPFQINIRRDGAPPGTPFTPLMAGTTSIFWRSTFEPLRRLLPAEVATWIDIVPVSAPREAEEAAKPWIAADSDDEYLAHRCPDSYERATVIESANLDLATAARYGRVAICVDRYHAVVPRARLHRGDAQPVPGPAALELLVPRVDDLNWSDIHELRRHPGLRDYRAILREIEAAAGYGHATMEGFERAVRDEYERALHRVNQQLRQSTWGDRLTPVVITTIVGVAVGALVGNSPVAAGTGGVVGTVASNAAGLLIDWIADSDRVPRWITFNDELQARASRRERGGI